MPVYVYFCEKCQHTFEGSYKIDDRDTPTKNPCPNCNELTVKQQMCACGFSDPIRLGLRHPPEWFKDKLKSIKKNNPGSNFNMPF